ncbi:MAG: SUF system NifU family Fe-S cluster assembly protein [Dehalococcoidia bacterium]|nr:SUF system NifU family Fe-S cluster assembly protein [Dehalococcoidia bacterium]
MTAGKPAGIPEPQLDDLYQEIIFDHYRSPRNKGPMPDAMVSCQQDNPFCGDEITVELKVADGVVSDLMFDGRGCSISQASASMMTEELQGKPVDEALEFAAHFRGLMQGKDDDGEWDELGDLEALKGVTKFAVRVKCATLAWSTFAEAAGQASHDG